MSAPKIERRKFPGSKIDWISIYLAKDTDRCPVCGYPAEIVFKCHCTNEDCQNYDPSLLIDCPTAGHTEFDGIEDTEKLIDSIISPIDDDGWGIP